MPRIRHAGWLLFLLLATAPTASAWMGSADRPHHAELAEAAAALLPAEERTFLASHAAAFRRGALAPDGTWGPEEAIAEPDQRYRPARGGGGAVCRAEEALWAAAQALRADDGDAAAYAMGVLAHLAADLAHPMHTSNHKLSSLWELRHEQAAYDHRHELPTPRDHAPEAQPDTRGYLVGLAWRSSERDWPLARALVLSGARWSPLVREATAPAHALALTATADLLHTAFAVAALPPDEAWPHDPRHRTGCDAPQEALGAHYAPLLRAAALLSVAAAAWTRARITSRGSGASRRP